MKTVPQPGKPARQRFILHEARRTPALRIAELARNLDVSGETIRRDLDELGKAGLLRRIYGGATLSGPPANGGANGGAKGDANGASGPARGASSEDLERMAQSVAAHVEGGQTLIVSGGLPAQHVARRLATLSKDTTLITNDVGVAAAAASGLAEIVLCPGSYDPESGSVGGVDTVEYLDRFNADLAIITCSGLSSWGASDALRVSANVKRAILRAAARTVLLVEPGQLGRNAIQEICRLDALAEIVAGSVVPPPIAAACRNAGVKLTLA
jgi:DeoR/GlpR family transcriptional regulator of sugar metabolism